MSSSGALVMAPRLVPSAKVIGTSTATARRLRTVRRGRLDGVMLMVNLAVVAADGMAVHDCGLEHDPEKWVPVFGKDHAPTINVERDDDSKKSHLAPGSL